MCPGAVGQFFRVDADEPLHLNVELCDLLVAGDAIASKKSWRTRDDGARVHAVERLETIGQASSIADLAAACGYYDQSHLVRDCRQFSGGVADLLPDSGVANLIFQGREA